jgi:heptosyltransferase-2
LNPPSATRNPQPERLLVRGVNWLGDAVMTTPALQRLREARPDAHITLLTHAKLRDLWLHHPAVDSVATFEARESVFAVARRLRAQQFTTALVLPNSPRSALEAFLARIPNRVGLARPWRNWLLTQRIPGRAQATEMHKRSVGEIQALNQPGAQPPREVIPATAHHLHHYLHLAAALGASPEPVRPRLEVTPDEMHAIRQRFGLAPEDASPLFGLNPGAEYGPAKRWPRERFVEAAIELQRRTRCRWWIFGGRADEPLASGIAAEIISAQAGPPDSVRNLAGRTSLRDLCVALKACRLVLTNDTGPMHVAAAVGTPVVAIFGSTSPELTGPGLPGDPSHRLIRATVPCSPCFLRECPIDFRCMNGVAVSQIVEAALRIIR